MACRNSRDEEHCRFDHWSDAFERLCATPQPTWRAYCDDLCGDMIARWWKNARQDRILKTDLFEEAVGEGSYPHLEPHSRLIFGIDCSEKVTHAARTRYSNIRGIVADAKRLPFANSSFDGVLSTSTLDHFSSRLELMDSMKEISRVLRPGGILLLTLDNLGNPVIRLRRILPFRWLHRMGVLPYYVGYTCTVRTFRSILSASGFELTAETAVGHCPRLPAILLTQWADRHASERLKKRIAGVLHTFEILSRWPTRYLTGNYFAVAAVKRSSSPSR